MDDNFMSDDENYYKEERAMTRLHNRYMENTFKNLHLNEWMFYKTGGIDKIRAVLYNAGMINPIINIVESFLWNGGETLCISTQDILDEIVGEDEIGVL